MKLAEGVTVPLDLTPQEFERGEYERMRHTLMLAVVAESIPRRLGKDAGAQEMARDKRVARKVANSYRSLWAAYDREDAPTWSSRYERFALASDALAMDRRAGATVVWPAFLDRRRLEIAERSKLASGLALSLGRSKWGATRLRLLTRELADVARVKAEHFPTT